jgi:HD-GYP domain-containing protein (c-di-GMP phosphodiesterase class II)
MAQRTVSISIDQLRVGVTSSHPLEDENGLLLLSENTCITEQLINGMRDRGIESIQVDSRDVDALCGNVRNAKPRDVRETERSETEATWEPSKPVKEMLVDRHDEGLSDQRSDQLTRAMGMAKKRIDELRSEMLKEKIRSVELLGRISDVYAHSMVDDHDQTVGSLSAAIHTDSPNERSIRMAVLGMAIAIELGHDGLQTLEVGMAALLHDVGLYSMNEKYQQPIELLSEADRWEYRKHPLLSIVCLSDVMDLPHSVKLSIQQVHEQFDGSGYPRGVKGRRIHAYARILNVVDTYLQLTAPTSQRHAIVPHDALGFILHQASRGIFDPQVMRAFLTISTLFPLGSLVELDSGDVARVIRRPRNGFALPVLLGSEGNRIELESESNVSVIRPTCEPDAEQIRLTTDLMQSSNWHPSNNPSIV